MKQSALILGLFLLVLVTLSAQSMLKDSTDHISQGYAWNAPEQDCEGPDVVDQRHEYLQDIVGDMDEACYYLASYRVDQGGIAHFLRTELDINQRCLKNPVEKKAFSPASNFSFFESMISIYMADQPGYDQNWLMPYQSEIVNKRFRDFLLGKHYSKFKCKDMRDDEYYSFFPFLSRTGGDVSTQNAIMQIKENHPDIDLLRLVDPITGKTLNQYFKELEDSADNLGTRGFFRCVRNTLQGNYSSHPSKPSDKTFSRKEIISMCVINNTEDIKDQAAKEGYLYIGDIFSKEIE